MKQDYLDNLIEVGDKNHCEATMIWFHGYGANNWSFEPSMKMINLMTCLLYTSPSPRDKRQSRMPSSA